MTSGGARNRSGPQPDPSSGRSERRGLSLAALPAEGFTGEPPEFPLPAAMVREIEVWEQAWRTPQAAAWIVEPWRWRTVAMWCRWSVRMEDPEAGASLGAVVVRLADQIGLTPGGLKENGWKIAADETTPRRAATATAAADTPKRPRSRFKVVTGPDDADEPAPDAPGGA